MAVSASLDSVVQEVERKDAFIENFKLIMSGKDHKYNQIVNEGNLKSSEVNDIVQSEEINPIDSQFRVQFEEVGVDLSLDASAIADEMEDFYLFKPVDGIVSDGFDPGNDHLAIDIVAKQDEPVKAVADGTVVFASWTQDSGFVMAIQHTGNLISMYKHNSDLLKNVGNFVSAGEVISIIGNTGELTSGPHLHFELWYNGNPINPEEFIRF
jgi:murein DD-endopeptidase MepM/ murein hydrolase activator NlpD